MTSTPLDTGMESEKRPGRYQVMIADNFDRDASPIQDQYFDDFEGAVQRSKEILDASLLHLYQEQMTADELTHRYKIFGDLPMIFGTEINQFSPYKYVDARAHEIIRLKESIRACSQSN